MYKSYPLYTITVLVLLDTDISGFVILMMMYMSMSNNSVICYKDMITMNHTILGDGHTKYLRMNENF